MVDVSKVDLRVTCNNGAARAASHGMYGSNDHCST